MSATSVLRRTLLALFLLAFQLAASTSGQIPEEEVRAPSTSPGQAAAGPEFAAEVRVDYILIPVVVRSPRGYVSDLTVDDFRLFVDEVRTPIASFDEGSRAPISLALLQDLSGSMMGGGKLEASRRAVNLLLEQHRAGDLWSLSSFAGGVLELAVDFTDEPETIRRSMNWWHPSGTTNLQDAIASLPSVTGAITTMNRAAVLVTDGADNDSAIDAHTAREAVRSAELPVYVLGLSTGSPWALDADGKKLYRHADMLNLLAYLTGGRYFWISGPEDVEPAIETIVGQLRHQYVLGFPTSGLGEPGRHEIRVETRKKKHRLSHRRFYEGTDPVHP